VIRKEKFTFITNKSKRELLYAIYSEVFNTLRTISQPTYFSCIFSLGSIIETMTDELFERSNQKVWNKITSNQKLLGFVKKRFPRTRIHIYPNNSTLGPKIAALRILSEYGTSPVQRATVLQMIAIQKYRNLIHTNKGVRFRDSINRYVAQNLFTWISHIASDLWPKNVNKMLKVSP